MSEQRASFIDEDDDDNTNITSPQTPTHSKAILKRVGDPIQAIVGGKALAREQPPPHAIAVTTNTDPDDSPLTATSSTSSTTQSSLASLPTNECQLTSREKLKHREEVAEKIRKRGRVPLPQQIGVKARHFRHHITNYNGLPAPHSVKWNQCYANNNYSEKEQELIKRHW